MSAYGYNKQTTPWLDSMKTNDNFIKFTNVYSCHTHTVPVLTYALSSKNQYNNIALQNAISVLDVAKACNIKTAWLSNQVHYGGYDTPVSVIADTAQQQKWINNNIGLTTRTKYYDIKLVDELNKIKIYDNMLIVIHLMGNHLSYGDRYPRKFNIFGEKNNHTKYDNSILHNDYVVKNIYETVKNFSNFKVLLYCSDHSEAVDQNLAHDSSQFVPDMTYIPMYLYVSDSYKKDNINIFNNLYKNKDSYFTNDLLFNLLLGLLNIKISDIYEKDNDITGEHYNNNFNRFKTLHGSKSIKKI
jgi:heptose-I-phosphate ethanolaminephosphotransferase